MSRESLEKGSKTPGHTKIWSGKSGDKVKSRISGKPVSRVLLPMSFFVTNFGYVQTFAGNVQVFRDQMLVGLDFRDPRSDSCPDSRLKVST